MCGPPFPSPRPVSVSSRQQVEHLHARQHGGCLEEFPEDVASSISRPVHPHLPHSSLCRRAGWEVGPSSFCRKAEQDPLFWSCSLIRHWLPPGSLKIGDSTPSLQRKQLSAPKTSAGFYRAACPSPGLSEPLLGKEPRGLARACRVPPTQPGLVIFLLFSPSPSLFLPLSVGVGRQPRGCTSASHLRRK